MFNAYHVAIFIVCFPFISLALIYSIASIYNWYRSWRMDAQIARDLCEDKAWIDARLAGMADEEFYKKTLSEAVSSNPNIVLAGESKKIRKTAPKKTPKKSTPKVFSDPQFFSDGSWGSFEILDELKSQPKKTVKKPAKKKTVSNPTRPVKKTTKK